MMQGALDLTDPANVKGEYVLAYNPCAAEVVFDWGTGCGLIQTNFIFDVAKTFITWPGLGGLNKDGCVDVKDTDILVAILRSNSEVQANYDLTEGGGVITDLDFSALVELYGNGCSA